jgi:tartrate dehydrogenase/decarboxylase/D-malate dehydrogenase
VSGPAADRELRVAVVAGDGIGPEVTAVAMPLLAAAARLDGTRVSCTELDWGGDRLLRTGAAMPEDAVEVARAHDAVFFGAVGHPELAPHVSVWTLVLPLRKALDLYVNLRPVVAWRGLPGPVAGGADADFVVVRENTEGEYSGIGGRVHVGTPAEVATEVAVHSRFAIERVARYAFALARERRGTLTLVTKSNVMRYGYALWDEVVAELGAGEFADVTLETAFVDAMAARMIERPGSLDVLLCSNLFGDVLSDLGAPLAGGLGMAPSGNLRPGSDVPGFFEPVHGSAPDIAGRGIANPSAAVLSAAMLLDDTGCPRGADALRAAVGAAVADPRARTPDLGGDATTEQAAAAIGRALEAADQMPAVALEHEG